MLSMANQQPNTLAPDGQMSLWERFCGHFNPRPPDDDEPQDWWIASIAIPLVAAATGPFANVMSIVALAMPWRANIYFDQQGPDGTPVQVLFADPSWCIALNATSLALGLAGNIFLLFNFTRVVRYIIALPLSIILWTLSMAILVGITTAMHIYAPPISPNQVYSQAYWCAVIAAALYAILTLILMVNMLGYFLGHYPQHFALTDGQRTLILQTIAFGVWLIIGAAVFKAAIGISFADALYFSDVTILTLGFGDIPPTTSVARGLVFPYAVMGIIILGLVVGSINKFFREVQYANVDQKQIERRRKATVSRSEAHELESGNAIEYTPQNNHKRPIRSTITAFYRGTILRPKLVAMREEKARFDAMRAIQRDTARFHRWYNLVLSVIAFGILWTCGAVVFWLLEDGLTYFEALYFTFCSLLTIGYGDIAPKSNAGKPFFVVWSLLAIPTMTSLISKMGDTIVAAFKHATSRVADWTVLPHSAKYRALLARFPRVFSYLQRREEKTRIAHGFPVGPNSSQPQPDHPIRSIEELATNHPPSDRDLAQELAFAIRRTTRDAVSGEGKHYSYEEWVEFTRMIRFTDPSPEGAELDEDEFGVLNWDWIGEGSPMLALKTESEWVLDRLCESLIRYVAVQGRREDLGEVGEVALQGEK